MLPPLDATANGDAHTAPFPPPPKDLFKLVEHHPVGPPAHLVQSYLGQVADAIAFLHMCGTFIVVVMTRMLSSAPMAVGAG